MVVGTLVSVVTCPLALVVVSTETWFPEELVSRRAWTVLTCPLELWMTSVTTDCPSMTLVCSEMVLVEPWLLVEWMIETSPVGASINLELLVVEVV